VPVQEGNLTCVGFPHRWDDVVRVEIIFVQLGKLARDNFPPWWYDVI
jgi:hypothetical protein